MLGHPFAKRLAPALAILFLASACGSAASTGSGSQGAKSQASTTPSSASSSSKSGTSPASTAASSASGSSTASSKLINMDVGYPAPTGSFLAIYVAKQDGIFKKNGLNVTLDKLSGSGSEVAALSSGGVQLAVIDAGSALPALAKGIPAKFVGAGVVHSIWTIWGKNSIKSVKDLQGHTLGLEHVNGSADVIAREELPKLGVDLSKVKIKYIGGSLATMAALVAGKVDAVLTNAPAQFKAQAKPSLYHQIYDFRNITHVSNGFLVMSSYAKSNPQAIKDFLTSWSEAIHFENQPQNEKAAEAAIAAYTHVSGSSALAGTVAFYKPIAECVPNLTTADLQDAVDWTKNHYHETVNPASVLDLTYLNQIKSSLKQKWCSG